MTKLEKLSKDVKENFNKEDGYWQTILDLAYNEWQDDKNKEVNSYTSMIEWTREKYGDFAVMVILLGKFNQQVCNGGHMQYYDNGYASRDDDGSYRGGFGHSHGEQIALHEEIAELMNEFALPGVNDLTEKVYNVVKDFKVEIDDEEYTEDYCYECGGSGEMADYDDPENDEYVTCSNCDGSGTEENYNENYGHPYNTSEWDSLDTRYYEVNEEWEKWFENYVKSELS